ncbi:UDP-N-acetylglucosamine 4,6-dehydratase (inverting) [Orenia metallireducens]|uniref:UDP-N-acetylglucosamine 4,6-dehydratase (Inverting) n=1 Tax=Orenia metallireducens TaxID=1413210 RepID=A0A1C0AB91_9FIRM|nr:UDP-N-acetylglucosamine 4,6-dehydratase (inverting) [Orenia metallireducens]OCL27631.1 UDP-N-acetylglucosamine 4,6-dehydratase (inverting) [Orenia metallireducens]
MLEDKTLLVTGGTGSFGKKFTEIILERYNVKKIIIFSRGELKQAEMRAEFGNNPKLRFFIGDVRDKDRLYRAFEDVDIVIHAAALKRVPECEYNPFEAIKTNVIGAENIINASIDKGVEKVVALSTDKACNPINLYGATKLCSDKLFISGNAYAGQKDTRFSVVRYGNVMGSRGSVIPFFKKMKETGLLPITDNRMTRFWITLEDAVDMVLLALDKMEGGEIFVPKIPSMRITDLATAIAPECKQEIVGIRPGEKLYESLISEADARHTLEFDNYYIIQPQFNWWGADRHKDGQPIAEDFEYRSDTNKEWLTIEEMRKFVDKM